MPVFRILAAALALAALPAASQPAVSQTARVRADAPRILFAVADTVKLNDGTVGPVVTRLTYDPVAGIYVSEMTTGDRVLRRVEHATSNAGPTDAEAATAQALVREHPGLGRLIAEAEGDVHVEGGFPLVREAGHACGPGGRCVMMDVFSADGEDRQRLAFVVVDLRAVRVLDADADPDAETNFANPAVRRHSRRRR